MKQIHYVEFDEEITSVIDRLKKSKGIDNYFVLAKKALILQSVVNLKLLKKEADKMKKKVFIVTQDQIGQVFAQRAGIEILNSTEVLDDKSNVIQKNLTISTKLEEFSDDQQNEEKDEFIDKKVIKKIRLEKIGSSEFFESKDALSTGGKGKPKMAASKIVPPAESQILKSALMNDMLPKVSKRDILSSKEQIETVVLPEKSSDEGRLNQRRNEKIESLFQSEYQPAEKNGTQRSIGVTQSEEKMIHPFSKKIKMSAFVFFLAAFSFALIVFFISFLPKARVIFYPRIEEATLDLNVAASANENENNKNELFEAKIIIREKEVSTSFESTGTSNSLEQKARGKVIIFNEYSSSPQTLVATTRLLSSEGRLFRLIKNVSVPGMTSIEGEAKPGVVEVEVVADEPGNDYNIGPSKFTIPGFEGGPKYEKFYARSEKPMSGGASKESDVKSVSKEDLDKAKKETEIEAKKIVTEELKEAGPEGFALIPESIESEILESVAQARVGDVRKNFDYVVLIKTQAFFVDENKIKQKVLEEIEKKTDLNYKTNSESLQLHYRQTLFDYQKKIINLKASAKVKLIAQLDLEGIKNEILGKNEEEVRRLLGNYPQIREIEIDLWPEFSSKQIPSRKSRVEVLIGDIDKK